MRLEFFRAAISGRGISLLFKLLSLYNRLRLDRFNTSGIANAGSCTVIRRSPYSRRNSNLFNGLLLPVGIEFALFDLYRCSLIRRLRRCVKEVERPFDLLGQAATKDL